MEEVFAGFAADGEAASDIGARTESALNRIADGHVFVLNFFADSDAFAMMLGSSGTDIGKIIIEDDRAFIDIQRKDEVGVHDAGVGVDHEIGIDPKIKGVSLACGTDGIVEGAGRIERTGLQTTALEILDGVLGVFDDAA